MFNPVYDPLILQIFHQTCLNNYLIIFRCKVRANAPYFTQNKTIEVNNGPQVVKFIAAILSVYQYFDRQNLKNCNVPLEGLAQLN